jgi:HD-like signal output (HDOD) protein
MYAVAQIYSDRSAGSPTRAELSHQQQIIILEILDALEADRLDLPLLPDMAFKVRALLDDPDSSISQIEKLLSSDLTISLYLIKAANSAAFSTGQPVSNLHEAIPRLGLQMLYTIVMNITLTKLFKAQSPLINQKLNELWERSRIVAANCYVLAQQKKHLKPEVAMLAGLTHAIGSLPLYLYADRCYPEIDADSLEKLINTFSDPISFRLLQSWNFPDELIDVIANQLGLRHALQSGEADYVDVVTMANLHAQKNPPSVEWRNVFAAERLGYYPGDCKKFFAHHVEELAMANSLLGLA